jgi:hypothetical protein
MIQFFILFLFCFTPILEAIPEIHIPLFECPLNRQDKRRSDIAICAVFKNEADYLKEWIEFHRLVGVSHFYLYNNCSQDNYWLDLLKPYVEEGVVELFDVPFDSSVYRDGAVTHNKVQVQCYNHALNLAKGYNAWVAIIDTDEFICPVKNLNLKEVLNNYSYAAGLVVYWQIYGTSNIWDLEPGKLMIESLLHREPNNRGNGMFKSIVRPEYVVCRDPHCCNYLNNTFSVTPDHQKFSHTPNYSSLPVDLIRINHYTYRTLSFYHQVKKPRLEQWEYKPSPELEQSTHDLYNSVFDPVMLKFVENLKKMLLTVNSSIGKSFRYTV